jgi:hypothetical protein
VNRKIYHALLLTAAMLVIGAKPGTADQNIYEYAVPSSIHTIVAKAKTVSANQDELKKIGSDYGEAYRIKEATYTYTAPDRLEYKTHVGIVTVTYVTTNTERTVSGSIFHTKTNISKDVTKRNTLASLGLLPVNYLETMRVQYLGPEVVNGIQTQAFLMRYSTDSPTDNRRFEYWVDPAKHYVVQKRVWGGDGQQHETIEYKNPEQVLPGFWMPTVAEAYTPAMQLAGIVAYENISAS